MKKAATLTLILFLCGCKTTMESPMTHIEYTGEISQRGISITAKPPFWEWGVQFYRYLTKD